MRRTLQIGGSAIIGVILPMRLIPSNMVPCGDDMRRILVYAQRVELTNARPIAMKRFPSPFRRGSRSTPKAAKRG